MNSDDVNNNANGKESGKAAPISKRGLADTLLTFGKKTFATGLAVATEAGKTANEEDESSRSISTAILFLFLLPFKIPFVAKAMSAAVPKIKALVDKLPRGVFHRKMWDYYGKHPDRLHGKRAVFNTVNGFLGFLVLLLVGCVGAVLVLIQGCMAGLSGDEGAMASTQSDAKWFIVIFVACGVVYLLDLLFTAYQSVGIIRIRSCSKEDEEDVKSVVLATSAFILNIAILVLLVVGLAIAGARG